MSEQSRTRTENAEAGIQILDWLMVILALIGLTVVAAGILYAAYHLLLTR